MRNKGKGKAPEESFYNKEFVELGDIISSIVSYEGTLAKNLTQKKYLNVDIKNSLRDLYSDLSRVDIMSIVNEGTSRKEDFLKKEDIMIRNNDTALRIAYVHNMRIAYLNGQNYPNDIGMYLEDIVVAQSGLEFAIKMTEAEASQVLMYSKNNEVPGVNTPIAWEKRHDDKFKYIEFEKAIWREKRNASEILLKKEEISEEDEANVEIIESNYNKMYDTLKNFKGGTIDAQTYRDINKLDYETKKLIEKLNKNALERIQKYQDEKLKVNNQNNKFDMSYNISNSNNKEINETNKKHKVRNCGCVIM